MTTKILGVYVSLMLAFFVASLGEGSTDPNEEARTAAQLHAEGNKFFNQGRYEDAITVWLRESSLDPKNANTANNIGIAYRNLGQQSTAIEYHNRAIELNPRFGHAYYSLGLARLDRKEYEEAKNAFLRAAQLSWRRGVSYYNLGIVYHDLRDYPNAEASYLKAIQFGYGSDATYFNLGMTYLEWGNYSKALPAFREAKKINPQLPGIDSQIKTCSRLATKPLSERIAFWKEWKINSEGAKQSSLDTEKTTEQTLHFPVQCIIFLLGIALFVLLASKIAKNLRPRS